MTSIDLFEDFNDEYDRGMGDREDEDIEDQDGQNADANDPSGTKKDVDSGLKVVKVKRKLVTLNADRLKGPRGIIAVDDFYKNIKLKGRGYEKEDLTEIMKRLEHWAHNMFPKYDFDDSLAKIERLGRKREIAVHMTRYRLGDLQREQEGLSKEIISDDENDRLENSQLPSEPIDEFEELINQQIALSSTTLPSTTFHNMSGISGISSSTQNHVEPPPPPASKLTEEQKAIIEENRKRAMALREERLKREELKKQEESKSQITDDNFDDFI